MVDYFPEGAPRTDITKNAWGEIVQLDTYYPDVEEGDVAIGIDLAIFSRAHPLRGSYLIDQIYDEDTWGEYSGAIEQLSLENDIVHEAEGAYGPSVPDPALVIIQHIGEMGNYAAAVAVTTFPMEEATLHAQSVIMEEMINLQLAGSGAN